MFTLADYTPKERLIAAAVCKTSSVYLWQCATGYRSPSLKLSQRLMEHDSRLTVEGLLEPKRKRDRMIKAGKIKTRAYTKRSN